MAERLRREIVGGELPPGARIVESRLARSLGISRGPIREASRLLEREGLLVSQAYRGFSVRELTMRELIELTDFRSCVERYAIRIAVASPKLERLIEGLEEGLQVIRAHFEAGDRFGQVAADFHFHQLIVRSVGNRRLLSAFDQIATELRIAIRLMGFATADWRALAESHVPVIEALRTKDAAFAEKTIENHIHLAWSETIEELQSRMDAPLRA